MTTKLIHTIKIGLIGLAIVLSNLTLHATSRDPLQELVDNMTQPPVSNTVTRDGKIITTLSIPGSPDVAGTVTNANDGSVVEFTGTPAQGGGMSYTFIHDKGVSTTVIESPDNSKNTNGIPNETTIAQATSTTTNPSDGKKKYVLTSELIPGANCDCYPDKDACKKVETRKYRCEVGQGLVGFQSMIAKIVGFMVNIVLLLSVLAIVGLGIAWSFAGGDDVKAKSTIKTWGINILIGLIILFMFRYILQFLAPWIFR